MLLEDYLEDMEGWNEENAAVTIRVLLIRLLLVLKQLERSGIVHKDICCRTILAKDLKQDGADVVLVGFSRSAAIEQCPPGSHEADCLALFRTAYKCLSYIAPSSITVGNWLLDSLIAQCKSDTWAWSATEVCQQLDLKPEDWDIGNSLWKPLRIKRTFEMLFQIVEDEAQIKRSCLAEFVRPRGAEEFASTDRRERGYIKTFFQKTQMDMCHDETLKNFVNIFRSCLCQFTS